MLSIQPHCCNYHICSHSNCCTYHLHCLYLMQPLQASFRPHATTPRQYATTPRQLQTTCTLLTCSHSNCCTYHLHCLPAFIEPFTIATATLTTCTDLILCPTLSYAQTTTSIFLHLSIPLYFTILPYVLSYAHPYSLH